MEQLSKMLGPAVHCGKDTTHKTLETMGIARAWPQQCSGRTVQTDLTFSRYASAITEQKKCCELLANKVAYFFTGLKSCATFKTSASFLWYSEKVTND